MNDVTDVAKRMNVSFRTGLYVFGFGIAGVVGMMGIEYLVNSSRSPSHYVEYYDDTPYSIRQIYPVGTKPTFFSKNEWKVEVDAGWPEILRCIDSEGPLKDKSRIINANGSTVITKKKPSRAGWYFDEEKQHLMPGSKSGYWDWSGPVPAFPSKCRLEAKVAIHPSPGVTLYYILEPTDWFYFI